MKYDDLEEIGGVNLYSFIDNFRNGTGLDFMGLLADGDCCKNCETIKKLWEKKQGLESIGNMIIVNEWWDYLKNRFENLYAKVGYGITITCTKDLICGKGKTLMPNLSSIEKKQCNIRIGCDPNSDHKQCSLSVQTDIFVHELTHCDQMYLIDPPKSCREQLCLEIRGYFRERRNKEIFRDDPRNGIAYAWTSVYDLPRCKGMRLEDVSPRTVPEKRAFIKKCARVPWKGQQW